MVYTFLSFPKYKNQGTFALREVILPFITVLADNPDRVFSNRAKRRRTTIRLVSKMYWARECAKTRESLKKMVIFYREAELAAQNERTAPAYRPIEGNHKIYEGMVIIDL